MFLPLVHIVIIVKHYLLWVIHLANVNLIYKLFIKNAKENKKTSVIK